MEAPIDNSSSSASRLRMRKILSRIFINPFTKTTIYSLPETITFWKISPGALTGANDHPNKKDAVIFRGTSLFSCIFRREMVQYGSILHLLTHRLNILNTPFSLFYHEKGNATFVCVIFIFSNTLQSVFEKHFKLSILTKLILRRCIRTLGK